MQAAYVQVKGFREPLRAPLPALLPKVMTTAARSTKLLKAVLHVWLERHTALQGTMREFLHARRTSRTHFHKPLNLLTIFFIEHIGLKNN